MISLPSDVKRVLNESYEQQLTRPKKMVTLPCTDRHKYKEPVAVELTEARDVKIVCPKCGKEHFLVWSKIQDNLKWG